MTAVKILCLTLAVFCASIKAQNDEKIVGGQDATQGQFPYQVQAMQLLIVELMFF